MTVTANILDPIVDPLVRVVQAADGVGDGLAVIGFAILLGVIVSAVAWVIVAILVALSQP